MRITREDYVKANRIASREEEIKAHGRPVRIGGVHKSKKVYDRKRSKAEMKKALPYFFAGSGIDFFFRNRQQIGLVGYLTFAKEERNFLPGIFFTVGSMDGITGFAFAE